jgi:hypothetical protein
MVKKKLEYLVSKKHNKYLWAMWGAPPHYMFRNIPLFENSRHCPQKVMVQQGRCHWPRERATKQGRYRRHRLLAFFAPSKLDKNSLSSDGKLWLKIFVRIFSTVILIL